MWNETLFRSTSARLSLVYASLIVAAFLLIGVLIWFAARDTAETALRQDIELEVTAIRIELETEGLTPVISAIRARAEQPGAFEYWLADSAGNRLVGDFPDMAGPIGWRQIKIGAGAAGAESREEMLILTNTLPGGIVLSVGEDLARARAVQDRVLNTLASIGGVAVLICLIVGVLVTRRILSRMETLRMTLEKVAAGDITARFPSDSNSASDVEQIGVAVNTMLDRIEQLVGDVRRVSHDIAHDLRTPLTHLLQRLEQAKAESSLVGRVEGIEGAQKKAGEIVKTFDAILRLSEIEAGALRQRSRMVDLASIVENVTDAFRPDVEESHHHLEVSILERCRIIGDQDLLAQALANLIENAMRHTPVETRITVRTFTEDGFVSLEVADNGPGIPPEAQDAILEPYMRLDRSRTTPGSGLGLSIVAAIARFHDADLIVADASPGLSVSLRFH